MKFHISFEAESLKIQEKKTLTEKAKLIKNQLEKILRLKINLRISDSKRYKGKWHAFLDSKHGNHKHLHILLHAIDKNSKKIKTIGIERLILWGLYEYEGQCNMEFTVEELSLMSKNDIHLCISCWEKRHIDQNNKNISN